MKLIITGASGYVATEVVRQSLNNPKITSVIALARREISPPSNLNPQADASKLKSVAISDYGTYSDEIKQHFTDADACIWTVAVTPAKSRSMDPKEVERVCRDFPLAGMKAMLEARPGSSSTRESGPNKPFRFLYMSGIGAERDQTKKPWVLPQYCLMRGRAESTILDYAAEHKDKVEACVVKPGSIVSSGEYFKIAAATVLQAVGIVPKIDVTEVSAMMLDQVMRGPEKDTFENEDLVRLGRSALQGSSDTFT